MREAVSRFGDVPPDGRPLAVRRDGDKSDVLFNAFVAVFSFWAARKQFRSFHYAVTNHTARRNRTPPTSQKTS